MLTPRFNLSQTPSTVTFRIRAPYCSLGELDVFVDNNDFLFTAKPYYLRLTLPGRLLDYTYEKECSQNSFNSDTGEFTFVYKKAINGEHFEGLDFITNLLCPKVEVFQGEQKITILSSSTIEEEDESDLKTDRQYGFAMLGNYNFNGVSSEFCDVFDVDPIEVTLPERKRLKLQLEQGKFDSEHYLADFYDTEEILEIINLKTPWSDLQVTDVVFNDEELDFLKDLQNVEYKLQPHELTYCHHCLINILYAYCYDRRTTLFDGTVESGWTIVKISSSLSWFDGFTTSKEALISAFRRSVIYPLYRNFQLCEKVLEDLKSLLLLEEKYIIKCLIAMYKIFLRGDRSQYIINNLFISHYIRYIMKWDQTIWKDVVSEVQQIVIRKEDLGLNLREIEEYSEITKGMSSVALREDDSDDSSSDSETSSESTESSVSEHENID